MDLLSAYEDVLGQKINRDKTTLFFSKSVTKANKQIIKGILGVHEIQYYEKYLGCLPWPEKEKELVSTISKREYGENCKDGKENFFPKPEGRFS